MDAEGEEAAAEPDTGDDETDQGSDDSAPEASSLTTSQENAVRSAQDYLQVTAFSRTGLIGQLEFEGFSTEDATFAVDSLDIDYNEQAAAEAESYLEFSGFSRQGLIDQLVFEGYTQEQATYGVDQTGL